VQDHCPERPPDPYRRRAHNAPGQDEARAAVCNEKPREP
jgi:hypothetical protein